MKATLEQLTEVYTLLLGRMETLEAKIKHLEAGPPTKAHKTYESGYDQHGRAVTRVETMPRAAKTRGISFRTAMANLPDSPVKQ